MAIMINNYDCICRFVFQTNFGDIHMAFYEGVAPKTVDLIRTAVELGCYNTNHFFRVDKGFVAQTADVLGGRALSLSDFQREQVQKVIPLEIRKDIRHNKRGVLSVARHDDPNSGGTSFSILLGSTPHLDMNYAIFGEVTHGWEVLDKMEQVETISEGIFVMPKERITILSTYMYLTDNAAKEVKMCTSELNDLQGRFDAQAITLQKLREQHLP